MSSEQLPRSVIKYIFCLATMNCHLKYTQYAHRSSPFGDKLIDETNRWHHPLMMPRKYNCSKANSIFQAIILTSEFFQHDDTISLQVPFNFSDV